MDVPYFIKEHLWMSAFDEATLNTTVTVAVMILEIVNNWRIALQINILKKKVMLWTLITFSHRKYMLLL